MLEGRLGPGWDLLGSRTSDEDYVSLRKSLKKRPLDYFKQDFYADTAVFGGEAGDQVRARFLPARQDRVRVRLPVRSREAARCIRARRCKSWNSLNISKADRDKIDYKNLENDHRREAGEVDASDLSPPQRRARLTRAFRLVAHMTARVNRRDEIAQPRQLGLILLAACDHRGPALHLGVSDTR